MNRTTWLQDRRMQKFRDVLSRWEAGELSMLEAGELLGVSERQFRRYGTATRRTGEAGLVDRRLGRASAEAGPGGPRRADAGAALPRAATRAAPSSISTSTGEGPRLPLGLHLDQDAAACGGAGRAGAAQRGAHRRKRERRPLPGMMLHQDGSRHAWLEGQAALDLIVTLDDATSAIYSAFLVEEEGTASTFRALLEVFAAQACRRASIPTAAAIISSRPRPARRSTEDHPTQVGRALEQLGIEHIAAYSPEARGRSERMFGTLQDRLMKELARLACARSRRPTLHPRGLSAGPQRPLRQAGGGAGERLRGGRRSGDARRDPVHPGGAAWSAATTRCASSRLQLQLPGEPAAPSLGQGERAGARISRTARLAVFHGPRRIARYTAAGESESPRSRMRPA